MQPNLTVKDLESRWEKALEETRRAAATHPAIYRKLKAHAAEIVENPLDINDYFPTVEKLLNRLETLDPCRRGSIFDLFCERISPGNIWQVRTLRLECRDLLAHLDAFDRWKRERICLRRVK